MSDQRDGRTLEEIDLRTCQIWAEVRLVSRVKAEALQDLQMSC